MSVFIINQSTNFFFIKRAFIMQMLKNIQLALYNASKNLLEGYKQYANYLLKTKN